MMRNEIRRQEKTPVVYLLMVGQKNGTEKMMNDKTKLVKEAKKKSLLLVRLSKKIRRALFLFISSFFTTSEVILYSVFVKK